MKQLIGLGAALALALFPFATLVMADDSPTSSEPAARFHALSNLPAEEHAALTPLTDDELASIEGEGICVGCFVFVTVIQLNFAVFSGNVVQTNYAVVNVSQGANFQLQAFTRGGV